MSINSLNSLKPLGSDKAAKWRHIWHHVLDSKSQNESQPFSEAASLCVVLRRWLWPVFGHSWNLDTLSYF